MATKKTNGKSELAREREKSNMGRGNSAGTEQVPGNGSITVGEAISRMACLLTLEYAGADSRGCRYVLNQPNEPCALVQLPGTFESRKFLQIAVILPEGK